MKESFRVVLLGIRASTPQTDGLCRNDGERSMMKALGIDTRGFFASAR